MCAFCNQCHKRNCSLCMCTMKIDWLSFLRKKPLTNLNHHRLIALLVLWNWQWSLIEMQPLGMMIFFLLNARILSKQQAFSVNFVQQVKAHWPLISKKVFLYLWNVKAIIFSWNIVNAVDALGIVDWWNKTIITLVIENK